jgi:predicted nucleotide-binding protein (sugar kinase/HSP70/actin superfamily)
MLSAELARSTTLVGGLGFPYDDLLAAVLSRFGDTQPLGALDRDAMRLGRASLPRGQCAPLLATAGALLRRARGAQSQPFAFLAANSCGPCRYALFASTYRQVLHEHGGGPLWTIDQDWPRWLEAFGDADASDLLDALLAGDALLLAQRRLRSQVQAPEQLDAAWTAAAVDVAAAIRGGLAPLVALARHTAWHDALALRPREAQARMVLIGEPWSLHVDGDAQSQLARVLGDAGVEVEVPPLALWLAYRLWERSQPALRNAHPLAPSEPGMPPLTAACLRARYLEACAVLGMHEVDLPDVEQLASWAAPYLPAAWRGGYGHVEVGLAARARFEQRAHAVISVKSFGCIPSSGVCDGIVPRVLGDAVAFLALEVSEDAVATRESRLVLQIAAAQARASAETQAVCQAMGVSLAHALADLPQPQPLQSLYAVGPRRYACTLACELSASSHRLQATPVDPETRTSL